MDPEKIGAPAPPSEARAILCKYHEVEGCGAVVGQCEACHEPLCERHQSDTDKSLCVGCAACVIKDTKCEPLVDDEGVTHTPGHRTVPAQDGLTYRTLMRRICDMDDYQLEDHIKHVQSKIKEIETMLDYRRVDLASSQCEIEDRNTAKRKKLRLRSVEVLANGSKVISIDGSSSDDAKGSTRNKQLAAVAQKLKIVAAALGLPCKTQEDLAKIALIVRGLNKPKA